MSNAIRPMRIKDYAAAHRLWATAGGISLTDDDDSRQGIALYLRRNPRLCFVSVVRGKIVGTVLCGHDGRRGILRHLAVATRHRRQGIARQLVQSCLDALAAEGIRKCNIYCMDYNVAGIRFWQHLGARLHTYDWRTFQLPTAP